MIRRVFQSLLTNVDDMTRFKRHLKLRTSSDFGDESRQMLRIGGRFGNIALAVFTLSMSDPL